MGLIPQVKCGRCDRSYSGLRSRCPYCGARRNQKGKRVSDGDNATWKLIIGVLLIVVLIAAVVVILVTSIGEKNNPDTQDPGDQDINHAGDGVESQDGKNPTNPDGTDPTNPDGTDPTDPDGTDPTDPDGAGQTDPDGTDPNGGQADDPNTTQSVIAQSISVKQKYQNPAKDFTLKVNESITMTAVVTPSNVTSPVVWTSSDESCAAIVADDETGITAKLTGTGKGKVTITATVDGLSYEFVVYVKNG